MADVITRVPWQACTGNFLPPLNSMVCNDQKNSAEIEVKMDTMSGESGFMDVDEGSDVSQLEKEWRKDVASHFVAHYTGIVSPYYHCKH